MLARRQWCRGLRTHRPGVPRFGTRVFRSRTPCLENEHGRSAADGGARAGALPCHAGESLAVAAFREPGRGFRPRVPGGARTEQGGNDRAAVRTGRLQRLSRFFQSLARTAWRKALRTLSCPPSRLPAKRRKAVTQRARRKKGAFLRCHSEGGARRISAGAGFFSAGRGIYLPVLVGCPCRRARRARPGRARFPPARRNRTSGVPAAGPATSKAGWIPRSAPRHPATVGIAWAPPSE